MTETIKGEISSVDRPYPLGGPVDLTVRTSDYRMIRIRTDGQPPAFPGDSISCTIDSRHRYRREHKHHSPPRGPMSVMTTSNKELAKRAAEIAKGSDGLTRKAANVAAVALGTTGTVASARNALADLWQTDLRDAALDIIGRLAAERSET